MILERFNEILIKIKKTKEFENALRYFEKILMKLEKHIFLNQMEIKILKLKYSYLINFILSDTIIDIVNSYFGMFAKLNTELMDYFFK